MLRLPLDRKRNALFAGLAGSMLLASTAMADIRNVEVSIPAGDAVLAGTLTLPESTPKAAIVLVQGNGPHTRDQMISGASNISNSASRISPPWSITWRRAPKFRGFRWASSATPRAV
ncbi:hypothetical protein [uncultured Brevundimonas sp.]|uniref:hypothetical protein n=1 Tax=uncultured Brevundimonas sp. TaxID=213418 RepID=UPI002633E931|nr:hypothetical protein [uncultured Brevundimonas sp.]